MNYWKILRQTADEFIDDGALQLSAALSYYAAFSLAPLLLISIAVAGSIFGDDAVKGQVEEHLKNNFGSAGATAIQDMIANARKPEKNVVASILGIAMLLFGAGGVFGQLQEALNTVWGVKRRGGRGMKGIIKDRFLSFAMVLGTGFLLLTSMLLTAFLQGLSTWVGSFLSLPPQVWNVISTLVAFVVIAGLFAAIFKVLPDARVSWSHVRVGAVFTAVLFTIGKFFIGWYLGREATASAYGATGALALVLLWVYYSSMILLFGAEFTQVAANSRGKPIQPDDDAVAVDRVDVERPADSPPEKKPVIAAPGRAPVEAIALTPVPSRQPVPAFVLVAPFLSVLTGWALAPRVATRTRSIVAGSRPLRIAASAIARFRHLHPSLFKLTLLGAAVAAKRLSNGKGGDKHH